MSRPLVLFITCLLAFSSGTLAAQVWQLDVTQSQILFAFIQEGVPQQGRFEQFEAEIHFDPYELEQSFFRVRIHSQSINTNQRERDDILRSRDFFDAAQWPIVDFSTERIESRPENYLLEAKLHIRDRVQALAIPLKIKISAQRKELLATAVFNLKRSDLDMARGDWADNSIIADSVTVQVRFVATPVKEE